ncbi:hypothetical protein KZX45_12345 [Georgenia sp. EYE_87]|uniref:hypothetical protein n=1 Tax=Georgenia sp. EYE_87 TaxID=2853448 RepID=UPI00200399AE|nr:hypothetical protein [Georgenia sp. EYE_87]MCK6211333.1 hypothetical protein [Georgenia sp. EYE_87]
MTTTEPWSGREGTVEEHRRAGSGGAAGGPSPGGTARERSPGGAAPADPSPPWARRVAVVAGAMMVGGAGLNTYMTLARPGSYAGMGGWFQEISPWDLGPLPALWEATFGEHPRVAVPVVGIGFEATIGLLALSRDPRRRAAGLGGIAAFHTALLGMGLWAWALPWLGVLVPAAVVTARAARR